MSSNGHGLQGDRCQQQKQLGPLRRMFRSRDGSWRWRAHRCVFNSLTSLAGPGASSSAWERSREADRVCVSKDVIARWACSRIKTAAPGGQLVSLLSTCCFAETRRVPKMENDVRCRMQCRTPRLGRVCSWEETWIKDR